MNETKLISFLQTQSDFFIEVEGTISKIQQRLGSHLSEDDEGVCALEPNSNKWGLEYRLYTHERPAPPFGNTFHSNTAFRHPEYEYRFNDNSLIASMLSSGFRLGKN